MYYYFDSVLKAINYFIEKGIETVNTKRIRRYYNIKSSNKTKICFIWLNLDFLEKRGYLELIQEKPTKSYRLPKNKIKHGEQK